MEWYNGSIPDAIAEVKNFQKILLVFIVGEDDLSKKMIESYDNATIASKLTPSNCVALKLVVNSIPYQQFSQIYPVVVIPSSFFIGKNGQPIEVITGSLDPIALAEKVDKIFQYEKQQKDSAEASTSSENIEPMEASDSSAVENGCESTSQPMAATADIPLDPEGEDPEALEDRVQRAKTLIENRRQNKAIEEQEKERAEEQERRKVGKALQKAQQFRQENELKEWAESRAKEKEEERQARERVRQQIAQDKAERAARFQQTRADEAEAEKAKLLKQQKEEQEKAQRQAAQRSTNARLQFRLPDGTSITQQFAADATLGEAKDFVSNAISATYPSFTLCTTFPRRHFTEANYAETLRDLELAPSAAILVLPGSSVAAVSVPESSFLANIFWMLVSPILTVWRTISSFFTGRPQPSAPPSQEEPEPQPGPSGQRDPNGPVKRRVPHDPSKRKFFKEGNIYRINSRPTDDDDDDNNTWNGNSTQQM